MTGNYFKIGVFIILCIAQSVVMIVAQPVPAKYTTGLPFPMPEVQSPVFPDRTINIKDYGARSDGQTMNTEFINTAIQVCSKAGGGTIVVPAGTWLTGPIRLESNINLRVDKGALVQFSRNIKDYPFMEGLDDGQNKFRRAQLISAYKAKNIAITGEGIFDGAGEVWRYVRREDLTELQWKTLVGTGGVVSADREEWWPSKEALGADQRFKDISASKKMRTKEDYESTKEYFRPNLASFIQCNGVLLDGPTFENSPRYHIIPQQCENLVIRNVKVFSPASGKNTDGIDPSACRNVVIYNCTIDVGDDGICLKPGTIAVDQNPGPACENIVIADCVVYHAHGGFVIGSESFGGARNVSVSNCCFIGTDVGLRFKSMRGRGGVIEKIFIKGIQMRAIVTDAILFDMNYSGGSPADEAKKDLNARIAEPVTERTPQFKDFYVKDVVCNGADRAIVINGLPELSIKNIFLDNVSIQSSRGVFIADADGIKLDGCNIIRQAGSVYNIIQSRNVTIKGGTYAAPVDLFLKVSGERSENIRLMDVDLNQAKKQIELEKNVRADAVKQE